MNRTQRLALSPLIAIAGLLAAAGAHAESNFVTTPASGTMTATARLDFRVTVPRVLYLRVGTGTALANNTAVDLLDYTVPAANVGDGTPVTGVGGDLGAGAVTARVLSNVGAVTLTNTTTGALNNGGAGSISFGQFTVTPAVLNSATPLPHPVFVDGATSSAVTVAAVGGVAAQDAKWTFVYNNTVTVPPGSYGGANTNNGRVTYTATSP